MADVPRSRPKKVLRSVGRWCLFLVLFYGVIVFFTSWFENRLVFIPTRADEDWIEPTSPGFEDVWITSDDGTRIHAWYLPHPDPNAGTLLYSHGNGGNISYRGPILKLLQQHLGRSILAYDYPGYGKSEGRSTEAGCYAAGDAAYRWLTVDRGFPAGKVVLFGESLGGGVAIDLATRHDHEALVIAYTFTTLPAAAKFHYPFLPCETLMVNRFDNLAKIGQCRRPVFLMHGTADVVVPFSQGEMLFAAANEPKRFLRLDHWHHDIPTDDGFYLAIQDFLKEPK